MGTTNYTNTFIAVAEDSLHPDGRAEPTGITPPHGENGQTIAELQFELLQARPYAYTSDELLFEVHSRRKGLSDEERDAAWDEFFAKDQACLRSSPLAKRYGWGFHFDERGRVGLVPVGSTEYERLAADTGLAQKQALRSSRTA